MVRSFLSVLCVCVVSAGAAGQAAAAEVTMRLRGSDLTFRGTVLSFDGTTYKLATERFGKVDLNAAKFECVAGDCPAIGTVPSATPGPDFGLYGSSSLGVDLMPLLIGGYAMAIGAHATLKPSKDISKLKIEIADDQGAKLAAVDLRTDGSSSAFTALAEGQASIGMSSRKVTDAEVRLLPNVREHVVAYDGIVVIVSTKNPLTTISTEQLAAVFNGTISDWSQLGQPPGKINVYARNAGSGTSTIFNSIVFDTAEDRISPAARRLDLDAKLARAVAGDPLGIGFTSFAHKASAKALSITTACGITHAPTAFGIKTQQYPFSRNLFFYVRTKLGAKHAAGLVNYALSDQAQTIVAEAGFINRSWEHLSYENHTDLIARATGASGNSANLKLMKEMIHEIGQLSRLSMTFRFRSNSTELDAHSMQKAQRLAALLATDQMRNRRVLLLGFSDAAGTFDNSRELSARRAGAVRKEMLRVSAGGIDEAQLEAKGFGELLPVDCNDDAAGRARNQRVEVWFDASATPRSRQNTTAGSPPAKNNAGSVPGSVQPERLFQEFLDWQAGGQN